ncbi:DUF5985 family protein [Ramlibacter albus]|nr:DUF5985 family protein [Ramlibacter albus]
MSPVDQMLTGAIALASFLAGLFFFRFWRQTRDTFFLYFAASFAIEGLNRIVLGLVEVPDEKAPLFYIVRLVAYGLILVAIWQKNRR